MLLFLFIALIFLIILSAFFSSSETGMMSINRYRLSHLARKGDSSARRIMKLLERPERLLGVILIGNTFANILASSLATFIAVTLFGEIGILIVTVVLTLVILIFAEVAPKTVAAFYPQQLSSFVALPLTVLLKVLRPLVWLVNVLANAFLRLLGIKVKKRRIAERLNAEELRTVVDASAGKIPEQHKDMLLGVLDLATMKVEDVMLPRNEVEGIDLNDSWGSILKQLINSRHVRFPVYRDNIDHVIGILWTQDVIKLMNQKRFDKAALIKVVKDPYFIPEGTPLSVQLHNFRNSKRRSALVVDEYGDIIGLLTLEDILEEIVGELDTDTASIQDDLSLQKDGSYLIDASASVRELNKYMHWQLPVDGPKTLSGLMIEHLETIPDANVCLKIADYRLEVIRVEGNKIVRVKVLALSS